ncbi:MAG: hypothetical protein ACI8UP_004541 [Porticoccaceae bacterium]|jgi:hypothetical protein
MTLLFQIVVTLFAASVIYDLLNSWRNKRVSAGFAFVFGGAATGVTVFVLMPSLADWLFGLLGIASGTNGAFFIAICVLLLVVKRQYQSINQLKRDQIEIVRHIALENIRKPGEGE